MNQCRSFSASINNDCEILILGSMPGVKSLEEQQYYAHPQNRFWKVMAKLCNEENLAQYNYNDKLRTLLKNKIALWDTLKFCKRTGSLDSNIKDEKPNDIKGLLKKYPNIKRIYLNGGKAQAVFKKHFKDLENKYDCINLPSTSPANARVRLEELISIWKNLIFFRR